MNDASTPRPKSAFPRALTAHNDAELQIVTVAGRHAQSANSHANGRMNMRSSKVRYSAEPGTCGARRLDRRA
jgi:hypothetical protein